MKTKQNYLVAKAGDFYVRCPVKLANLKRKSAKRWMKWILGKKTDIKPIFYEEEFED